MTDQNEPREHELYFKSVLDALSAEIAVLDKDGRILFVNNAWRSFALNNGAIPDVVSEGANYLRICDEAKGEWSEGASEVASGIRSVICGESPDFSREYPCHCDTERRWFILSVSIYPVSGPVRVVVSHTDITVRHQAEEALLESKERLKAIFEEVMEGRHRTQALSRRIVEIQESERADMARELHDEIGQILTALSINIQIAHKNSEGSLKENLADAMELVGELMKHVRNLTLELRPAMLDDLGLFSTLRWHFERYKSQTGIAVDFDLNGTEIRFSHDIETTIFRITQEALSNVARYAQTDRVSVKIVVTDKMVKLLVRDFGEGFMVDATSKTFSGGLVGMRERAALLGGVCDIISIPGQGTEVQAQLPLSVAPG